MPSIEELEIALACFCVCAKIVMIQSLLNKS
ncbi:MAG: hypothetical protein RSB96_02650 [Oscillospiraceae bacterium]